jgi:hypothetical protein
VWLLLSGSVVQLHKIGAVERVPAAGRQGDCYGRRAALCGRLPESWFIKCMSTAAKGFSRDQTILAEDLRPQLLFQSLDSILQSRSGVLGIAARPSRSQIGDLLLEHTYVLGLLL